MAAHRRLPIPTSFPGEKRHILTDHVFIVQDPTTFRGAGRADLRSLRSRWPGTANSPARPRSAARRSLRSRLARCLACPLRCWPGFYSLAPPGSRRNQNPVRSVSTVSVAVSGPGGRSTRIHARSAPSSAGGRKEPGSGYRTHFFHFRLPPRAPSFPFAEPEFPIIERGVWGGTLLLLLCSEIVGAGFARPWAAAGRPPVSGSSPLVPSAFRLYRWFIVSHGRGISP